MEMEYRLEDIDKAAQRFLDLVKGYKILAFSGEIGAGKTTFIHAVCHYLGVSVTMGSPTFSIINEYESAEGKIYHIDLYRCKDEDEAVRAGVEDYLYSGNMCLVEWPSRAAGIFPPLTIHAGIGEIDESTRKITIDKFP